MRMMDANKRTMWLSRYGERTELVDSGGFGTGEYVTPLSKPRRFRGNWAPPTGLASYAPFGTQVSYDVAVVLDDNRLGIREGDVIWLGGPAPDAGDGEGIEWDEATGTWLVSDSSYGEEIHHVKPDMSHAYQVRRIASLWNGFAFALKSMGGE